MRYSIITPTLLRQSLIRLCQTIDVQTCTDWEHLVVVDSQISNDVIAQIDHPQRMIIRCDKPHCNWGHTCRHGADQIAKGDYLWHVDDDNYLPDDKVLETLNKVTEDWAIFPILRFGEIFPGEPKIGKIDTGSFIMKKTLGPWPAMDAYDADGQFAEQLAKKHKPLILSVRPLMVMPDNSQGYGAKVSDGTKVSIFTASHTNFFLREAYESIKDQDFDEWIIVFNNGGVPTNFGDPRVKSHVLYKAPEMVGPLKAYACQQAKGDILLELDNDDMLLPGAIKEVREAFANPKTGFVYSNTVQAQGDLSKRDRFTPGSGWKYREVEFKGKKLDELVAFDPTPEAVSRIWFAPDHLRSFRRSVYNKIGGYRRDLKVLDDGDLIIRMYLETEFKHIDKPLYLYRVHGQNSWLKFNKEIQDGVFPLYDKYIHQIVERWANLNGHALLEMGNPTNPRNGYRALPISAFKNKWPLADSSVGVIVSTDALCELKDPVHQMKEISRVLVPGGWALIQIPSTDGRGAYQDPRHVSFWNENSFLYYTNRSWAQYLGTPARFQAPRLYTTEKNQNQVCWTIAHLVNLKSDYRPCGLVEI